MVFMCMDWKLLILLSIGDKQRSIKLILHFDLLLWCRPNSALKLKFYIDIYHCLRLGFNLGFSWYVSNHDLCSNEIEHITYSNTTFSY